MDHEGLSLPRIPVSTYSLLSSHEVMRLCVVPWILLSI